MAPNFVRVYVVTYRRPHLLERALRSLIAQTHRTWVAEVLNDDPADSRVAQLITSLGDPRIQLSAPAKHRGGTGNFNHAFRTVEEPYASILEDDNWWEPQFLETMLRALDSREELFMAVANERLWQEQPDGSWLNTGKTIWPPADEFHEFHCRPLDKCGPAKLCNSSVLFRTRGAEAYRTPDSIPVDVTEHFRERVIPHPVLLVHTPLVNYAETLTTHRSKGHRLWHQYQMLLIGSVFKHTDTQDRRRLAADVWSQLASHGGRSSRNVLLLTAIFISDARELWREGSWLDKLMLAGSCLRRPSLLVNASSALRDHECAWRFLQRGWFAEFMSKSRRTAVLG